jgi:hypothetical protein
VTQLLQPEDVGAEVAYWVPRVWELGAGQTQINEPAFTSFVDCVASLP